jgi:hypothetical protein
VPAVITFLTTGNIYLTVISVGKEFYAEYSLAQQAAGRSAHGGHRPCRRLGARDTKNFEVDCLSCIRGRTLRVEWSYGQVFTMHPPLN